MFSRDNRRDDIFTNSTIDTSNPDKIIIREKEPRKKVRKRVKKSDKKQILAKKEAIKKADKVKVVKNTKAEKDIFDTTSFEFVDVDSEGKGKEEKFRLPRLSEINKKRDDFDNEDLGSDFRRSSADWKDSSIPDYSELNKLSDSYGGGFFDGFKRMSALQWVALLLAVVLFVSSVLATNVYARLQCKDSRVEAFSKLSTYEDTTFEQIAEAVEDVEMPISMDEATPQLGKILSLVLSSVEKDLKIKLVDEDDTLVKNIPWSVTVADSDGNSEEVEDDDKDGIIHMTDVSAGDYSVTLNAGDALKDYELPMSAQTVSVKAKVEYKVIADIKEEIKSEKEINAAAEDVAGNQAAEAEAAPTTLTDTVEFVESTKTLNGEDFVEATVDLTKTAKLKDGNKLLALANSIKDNVVSAFGNSTIAFSAILADTEDTKKTEYEKATATQHKVITYSEDGLSTETHLEDCTFDDSGKCSKCGNEKCSHSNKKQEPIDSKHHKIVCEDCGATITESEDCSFSDNNTCACGNTKPEDTISLDKSSATLKVGETVTLTATVSSGTATFSSSDSSIATVDSSGKVTAVKAGSAMITASANNKTATCAITVTAAETQKTEEAKISFTGTTTVKVGETTKITATVTPSGKKITGATPSDSSIATASVDGNTITVKGVKAGATKISVTSDNGTSSSITITVTSGDTTKYSEDAQLYDASKNALYVKEGDSYRLAKYRDYINDSTRKFYRKVEAFLYTGWQTIDGQKCYFDKNHNKVTGKQIIGGVEYDFGEGGTVSTGSGTLGIDVSKYQPSINWSSVKSSGVDYVIIRCGYRGSSTGVLVEDPYFKSHIKGAKAAGLKVGVYFFTTAVTEAEAVEEASMCAYLCNGYGLDFPIFMDCENSPRAGYNGMSSGQRTAIIKAFCNTIRSAGYSAGVYANKTWLTSYMNAGELSGYKIWLAQYNSAGPTYSGKYDMWQYTSKGSVNGISGYVDMNKCYYR